MRWAWPRVGARGPAPARRARAHRGRPRRRRSLAALARAGRRARARSARLVRWHLVQEPLPGRFALHATVRHAIAAEPASTQPAPSAHYVGLLERHPERLDLEQTHLFAAMDHAHITSDLGLALRLETLLERLGLA